MIVAENDFFFYEGGIILPTKIKVSNQWIDIKASSGFALEERSVVFVDLRSGDSRCSGSLPPLPPGCAGDAGSVRSGQQPGRPDAAEVGGADGPQPEGHPGEQDAAPPSLSHSLTPTFARFLAISHLLHFFMIIL